MRRMPDPGTILGYRKDGRPIRVKAGGAYNACVPEACDLGLAAWTLDPATAIVSTALATTVQYLAGLYYKPEYDTPPLPSRIFVPNGIVGTSTAFQVGLITMDPVAGNPAGTLLASSPAAGTLSAGLNAFALTYIGAAPPVLPQGRYWIAFVNTTGTTTTILSGSNPGTQGLGLNVGTDLAHTRFGVAATTGALGNIVPGSITAGGAGFALCAALG
jgi:hypothetical protein